MRITKVLNIEPVNQCLFIIPDILIFLYIFTFILLHSILMVYIDNFNIKYRNMIMCHMIADTTEELLNMATQIGVNHKWIQDKGLDSEHFDICQKKKKIALSLGAKEVTVREIVKIIKLKSK